MLTLSDIHDSFKKGRVRNIWRIYTIWICWGGCGVKKKLFFLYWLRCLIMPAPFSAHSYIPPLLPHVVHQIAAKLPSLLWGMDLLSVALFLYLVQRGADINLHDSNGMTALDLLHDWGMRDLIQRYFIFVVMSQ